MSGPTITTATRAAGTRGHSLVRRSTKKTAADVYAWAAKARLNTPVVL